MECWQLVNEDGIYPCTNLRLVRRAYMLCKPASEQFPFAVMHLCQHVLSFCSSSGIHLLIEAGACVVAAMMLCVLLIRQPQSMLLSWENRRKWHGAMSAEYDGCGSTILLFHQFLLNEEGTSCWTHPGILYPHVWLLLADWFSQTT